MIEPGNAGLVMLPWGGSMDAEAAQLEETLSLVARHREVLEDIVASLESMERTPLVQEASRVLTPMVRARALAKAAAQALEDLSDRVDHRAD